LLVPSHAKYPEICFEQITQVILDTQNSRQFSGKNKLTQTHLELCFQAATISEMADQA